MAYFLAAFAACGVFVAAGWRSKRIVTLVSHRGRYDMPLDPLWPDAGIDLSADKPETDAAAAIRLVMKRLGPLLKTLSVEAEVAAPPGLLVRMRSATLVDLLEELLGSVTHNAPASRILLTAAQRGDHVEIGLTDDMPGADPAMRQAMLRGQMERVALRGGTLDVEVRPAEGTTITLRLAAADARKVRDRSGPDVADSADLPGRRNVPAASAPI